MRSMGKTTEGQDSCGVPKKMPAPKRLIVGIASIKGKQFYGIRTIDDKSLYYT